MAAQGIAVTQVTTFYKGIGGVERAARSLAETLVRTQQADMHALATKLGPRTVVETLEGVKLIQVGAPLSVCGRPLAIGFPNALRQERQRLLHFHLPFPLACASHLLVANGAKAVATWHHDIAKYPRFRRAFSPVLEQFLDHMSAILVTSPSAIDTCEALSKRKSKCHVVPLSVDCARFSSPDAAAVAAIRNKYPGQIVLFVGRLVYYKGVEVLLESMAEVNATLLVVGSGPFEQQLKSQADRGAAANRIHFIGSVSDDELTNYYAACDVFVFPSTDTNEMFGLVQVEAMAAGKPVINTNLPTGVPWVSRHGESGLTVSPGSSSELAAALRTLVGNEELRLRLGAAAKERAFCEFNQYGERETYALYEAVLAGL